MSQSEPRKTRRASKKRGAPVKRNLTPTETMQFQEMNRTINARQWELAQIKNNTALIPEGQALVAQLEAVYRVLDDAGRYWISGTLEKCGYVNGTKCSINLTTGVIELDNEA